MVDPKKWNSKKRKDFEELELELVRNDGEREKQSIVEEVSKEKQVTQSSSFLITLSKEITSP